MSASDPVSWFVIEPGWKVVDSQGQEVGSVDEVVGDSNSDIFNGLSISTSLLGK
jgi:sporulation protein YlmC with PRC-barrel domain